jgi:hypothetical protein
MLFDKFGLSNGDFNLKLVGSSNIVTKVHIFTKKELKELLKKSGFKLREIHYFDYSTGKKEKTSWFGQIMIIAKKQ